MRPWWRPPIRFPTPHARTTGMRLASERTPLKKRTKKPCKEGDASDAFTCCSGELELDQEGLELGHAMGPPQAPAGRLTRSARRAAGKTEELEMLVPETPNPRRAANKKVGETGNEPSGEESDTSCRPTRQQLRDAEKAAREAQIKKGMLYVLGPRNRLWSGGANGRCDVRMPSL